MFLRSVRCFLVLGLPLIFTSAASTVSGQVKVGACEKPPEIASQPNSSDDNAKLKMFKAVGTVTLLVEESVMLLRQKFKACIRKWREAP